MDEGRMRDGTKMPPQIPQAAITSKTVDFDEKCADLDDRKAQSSAKLSLSQQRFPLRSRSTPSFVRNPCLRNHLDRCSDHSITMVCFHDFFFENGLLRVFWYGVLALADFLVF
jgi:excinuclease UvrABC nuclease subunit